MATVATNHIPRAFAHLNLRFNPFGELPPDERAAVAVVELDDLSVRLATPGTAIQFVGDHGRGKSTHLLALYYRHFPEAAWTKVSPGERPRFGSAAVQFVDSFDELPRGDRRRVYRSSGSLALTTHADLAAELAAAGFRVVTRQIAGITTARLAALVAARIEHARRDPGRVPTVPDVAPLIVRFGDNVRAIEAHLYECFQQLKGVGHVQV